MHYLNNIGIFSKFAQLKNIWKIKEIEIIISSLSSFL